MGWGRGRYERKEIAKYYKDSNPTLSGINIYHNYLGEWLLKNNDASLFIIDETSDLRYTENDFYIFNRMGVAQSFDELPSGVPADKISYRGLISAWIFRGSDLENTISGSIQE